MSGRRSHLYRYVYKYKDIDPKKTDASNIQERKYIDRNKFRMLKVLASRDVDPDPVWDPKLFAFLDPDSDPCPDPIQVPPLHKQLYSIKC